jgi:hypothetical protein
MEAQEKNALVGPQPVLRRSTRQTHQTTAPNIATTQGQTYGTSLNQQTASTTMEYDSTDAHVIAMIMVQFNQRMSSTTTTNGQQYFTTYSLKKGLQKFGERGVAATNKEMQQMIDRTCFVPVEKNKLTEMEKKRAIESLIFLHEKGDGTVKARYCANGSTQRDYMQRDEVASPTVSTESTILTAVVEAAENCDVATADIPNAFCQTEHARVDKDGNRTIMKIRGPLVSLLCALQPEYRDYVVMESGSEVLYVHVLRAIYGLMISSLLFYKKLSHDLVQYGFKINPYDPCVANKTVKDKQLTVSWHIDDLKVSHADAARVDDFMAWVRETYGQIGTVKETRGKIQNYLGMTLDYEVPGQVTIDMVDYVESMCSFSWKNLQ